ncbi:hypothetical protein QQ045_010916 [Rhodiola kirilowii]
MYITSLLSPVSPLKSLRHQMCYISLDVWTAKSRMLKGWFHYYSTPYAPPQKMQTHFIPHSTPHSIFVYFRGLFYDVGNDIGPLVN